MIPKRKSGSHRKYEGLPIDLKKECRVGCEWYRKIGVTEYCGGGKHFQIIVEGGKGHKCGTRSLIVKGKVKEHSMEYIDSFLEDLTKRGFLMRNSQGGIGIENGNMD